MGNPAVYADFRFGISICREGEAPAELIYIDGAGSLTPVPSCLVFLPILKILHCVYAARLQSLFRSMLADYERSARSHHILWLSRMEDSDNDRSVHILLRCST